MILAAGRGTRMRSRLPKVAHPLAGRPIVRHVIEAARGAGVDDVVVVVGDGSDADAVRASCGSGVRFAVQHEQLGTAHALESAKDSASGGKYVLIMNGDVPLVLPSTLRRMMEAVVETPDDLPLSASEASATDRASLALLTAETAVEEYGFLELDGDRVLRIIETKGAEGLDRTELRYINSGQYAAQAEWLWPRLARIATGPTGERYLTGLAAIAHDEGDPAIAVTASDADEVRGINDRVQLAEAEATMRDRVRRTHMMAGVTISDPLSTFIDADVRIGADTTILSGSHVLGETSIGEECEIGPNAIIRDSMIGARCAIRSSTIEESTIETDVDIGPYSHLRPRSYICQGAHIGNFAEVKASRLGRHTKIGHFSYVGDAEVGDDVNIGAGTITANYDGTSKHHTVIGDGAFIGSDTMLVAPVSIGRGARTSAGSVVTRDVPDGAIAIGAPARIRRAGAEAETEESAPGR